MGLEQRRIIQTIKETTLPEVQQQLQELLDKEITIDFDWPNMEQADPSALFFLRNFLGRMPYPLSLIARDALGKEALRENIGTIRIQQVTDNQDTGLKLDGQHLLISANFNDVERIPSDSEIQTSLESSL